MRVSIAWLREWLGIDLDPAKTAHSLTMAGLEIEGVEPAAPPLAGIVIGEVLECGKHPNADSLSLCRVSDGKSTLQIVCGAPNVRVGMKAPLATLGTKMPGGMEIKRAKLRGVESEGMLCSARELGLSDDAKGLMELPGELRTGQPLAAALNLDDTILEVNLTPNRGDCMSMRGVAREVAVLSEVPLREPIIDPVPAGNTDTFPVELVPGAGCVRFAARVIRGVRPGAQSPLWLQERLRRAGLRPISAVVDVTNYVMLELGQPMHAYDLRELDGGIVVRRARPGETLRLLDGRDVTLDESVMIIADRSKPLALAGVMGGDHSGIGDDTSDVLLEVAFFLPDAVAGRGRRYGLVTDASQRFERGVDPMLQERAIERATALLLQFAGGTAGPTVVTELRDELPQPAAIRLRPQRARMLIGAGIADARIREILASLGIDVAGDGDAWQVTPPSWRFDLAIEDDLIEEIARVYGFDNIPETEQLGAFPLPQLVEARVPIEVATDLLVQRGYREAITYSFVDPEWQAVLCPGAPTLALRNPISADLAVMRVSLWPGLARALVENQNRQQLRVRLFEAGRKFLVEGEKLTEVVVIAGLAAGAATPEQWGLRATEIDFFDVKADVEALLSATGAAEEFVFETGSNAALHPGQSAQIVRNGKRVGWLGRLHPDIERRLQLTYSAVVFELEVEPGLAARLPHYAEISRFPAVRRDLAMIVDEQVTVQSLLDTIRASAGALLTGTVVFDVYRGANIGSGRKSVAIGLNLQDVSRTLTDADADAVVAKVVDDLERGHGATIRDK